MADFFSTGMNENMSNGKSSFSDIYDDVDITAAKNEEAFAELIQFLDDKSLALVMRDARDNGRKALKILRAHYAGTGKPRVISSYTDLTSLVKSEHETVTDYVIRHLSSSSLHRAIKNKNLANLKSRYEASKTPSEPV